MGEREREEKGGSKGADVSTLQGWQVRGPRQTGGEGRSRAGPPQAAFQSRMGNESPAWAMTALR